MNSARKEVDRDNRGRESLGGEERNCVVERERERKSKAQERKLDRMV